MLVLFREDKEYNGVIYRKDCVYDLSEEQGFAMRWLKRGCEKVSKKDAKKILKDPRIANVKKKEDNKPVKNK